MDDHYDPTHKASSVSSTTSISTNGTAPSLYSATSSIGGDVEEYGPLEVFDPTACLSIPADDDYLHLYKQQQTVCNTADLNAMTDAFLDAPLTPPPRKWRASGTANSMMTTSDSEIKRQDKRSRDLLTDEERRANHIASEQKRRNAIRTGFKDLTDLIPTLKNINNSKSTVLFKAVEYVRHLEKRNRSLREKLASLQLRLEVEGRMGRRHSLLPLATTTKNSHDHHHAPSAVSRPSSSQLAPETLAALMAHKKQQRQLELLQEQLRLQQELLAKHNIAYPSASHIALPFSSPYLSSRRNALDAPSLNIPADDDHYGSELARHESLLNCHYRRSSS
ncbi:hypothetical protein BX666DRAFT_2025087 [Dichotomocladium elegans]|nr:hypothetical protein BX666DRAFT_2025087 [Dichotomocladium elegans]